MTSLSMLAYARRAGVGSLSRLWLLGLLILALQLVTPIQVAVLTDLFQAHGGLQPSWSAINTAIALILVAQIALAVLTYWQGNSAAVFRQNLTQCLALDVFSRLLRFSPDFFRENKPETINTRTLEDTRNVACYWSEATQSVPLAAVSFVVFGGYMVWTNWFLGLCLVPLSLLSGYFLVFDRVIQQLNRRIRDTWDELRVRSNEVVAGVAEFRNHAAFDYGLGIVTEQFNDYTRLMKHVGKWNAFFCASGPLVGAVQNTALYWVGAALCLSGSRLTQIAGQLTWGDVISFLLVAGLFREPIQTIAGFLLQSRMTKENFRRVREYLEQPMVFADSVIATPSEDDGNIAFKGIHVVTAAGTPILSNLDLTIPSGHHVAIVGPAGCGKSTAIQIIVRGISPTKGQLMLGNRDVIDFDATSLAARIGFVPQTPVLIDTTIRQNLLLGLRRVSPMCLHDNGGPLDVRAHPGVKSLEDLDCVLTAVVRRVGLDTDLVSKALDLPLPADPRFDDLRNSMPQLRTAVRARVTGNQALVTVFDSERLLIPGTIRDNIFGPGTRTHQNGVSDAEQLLRCPEAASSVSALLALGHRQYVADKSLAVRAAQRAPRLADLLARTTRNGGFDSTRSLADLPDDARSALLDFALDLDTETASRLSDTSQFETMLLGLRQRLSFSPDLVPESANRWTAIASGQYLSDLSLRENILTGRVDSRIYRAADQLDEVIRSVLCEARLCDQVILAGLEYRVGEHGDFLSGGQRQKVAIARILLKNPSILLLDEATANLDEISQARIVEMLRHDFAGRTVLSISHRLSTIMGFDEILVLDRGQLVQQGLPGQLIEQPGLFRSMISQQPVATRESSEAVGRAVAASAPEPPPSPTMAFASVTESIRGCDLFSELDSTQIAALERTSRVFECPANTVLFSRGDAGDEMFLICEGRVEFFASKPVVGSTQFDVLDVYGPGQTFGELAVFGNTPRTLGARAQTPLRLLTLTRQQMLQLIDADPSIGLKLLDTLARRIAGMRNERFSDSQLPASRASEVA